MFHFYGVRSVVAYASRPLQVERIITVERTRVKDPQTQSEWVEPGMSIAGSQK